MAMQPFALIALVADEVAGAEDQMVLGDADVEAFGHDLLGSFLIAAPTTAPAGAG